MSAGGDAGTRHARPQVRGRGGGRKEHGGNASRFSEARCFLARTGPCVGFKARHQWRLEQVFGWSGHGGRAATSRPLLAGHAGRLLEGSSGLTTRTVPGADGRTPMAPAESSSCSRARVFFQSVAPGTVDGVRVADLSAFTATGAHLHKRAGRGLAERVVRDSRAPLRAHMVLASTASGAGFR